VGTTTTTTTTTGATVPGVHDPILRYRIALGDRHGGLDAWREIVGTIRELTTALGVLWAEYPDDESHRCLDRASELIVSGRGLDHWGLWGVTEVLGPDAWGFGAVVGGHGVQSAGNGAIQTAQCSCDWFRAHVRTGARCEHLFALDLAIDACAVARESRGVRWRRGS